MARVKTNPEPKIAEEVRIDWGKSKFYVDGEEFPWFISEDGPIVRMNNDFGGRLRPPHVVEVEILDAAPFSVRDMESNPVIGGRYFPWTITGDGYVVRATYDTLMTVRLAFYADSVRHVGRKSTPGESYNIHTIDADAAVRELKRRENPPQSA